MEGGSRGRGGEVLGSKGGLGIPGSQSIGTEP